MTPAYFIIIALALGCCLLAVDAWLMRRTINRILNRKSK